MKAQKLIVAGGAILMASMASAEDWSIQGTLTRLEPTFHDRLHLRIDANAGSCGAGTWLFFYGAGTTAAEKQASLKAVYAGLLASLYAGTTIEISGVNQGCVIERVHLLGK
jgi:hypothetical protein